MDTWVHIRGDDDGVGAYGAFALPQKTFPSIAVFFPRAHVAHRPYVYVHVLLAALCHTTVVPPFSSRNERQVGTEVGFGPPVLAPGVYPNLGKKVSEPYNANRCFSHFLKSNVIYLTVHEFNLSRASNTLNDKKSIFKEESICNFLCCNYIIVFSYLFYFVIM